MKKIILIISLALMGCTNITTYEDRLQELENKTQEIEELHDNIIYLKRINEGLEQKVFILEQASYKEPYEIEKKVAKVNKLKKLEQQIKQLHY